MEVQYSKLSHSPSELKSFPSGDMETLPKDKTNIVTRKRSLSAWISTVWSLAAHCLLSIGIVLFVLAYINHRGFHVTDREPVIQLLERNATLPFAPIQSDIVTILSSLLVAQKWALAAWMTPLCWRIAIFLMERRGIHRQDLRVLVEYRLLAPRTFLKSFPALIIGILLMTSMVANLASPIVTGSIAWVPTNTPVHELEAGPIQFREVDSVNSSHDYFTTSINRDVHILWASGSVNIAWGREPERYVHKRVSSAVDILAVNSTIKEVTLPYFKTEPIQWIQNEADLPPYAKGAPIDIVSTAFHRSPVPPLAHMLGYVALIPDPNTATNWTSDPLKSTIIEETRLVVTWFGTRNENKTESLPDNIYVREDWGYYYAFAWVTFKAGVGRCREHNCIVSSPSTIRNNGTMVVEPHPLAFQALALALPFALNLVFQNASIPSMWKGLGDYVEAVLVRSYEGAWMVLNDAMMTRTVNSTYVPALPALVADVNQSRVYGWLGAQLLVTLLGVIFLALQSYLAKFPLIGDASLTAFYLDTTGLPESSSSHEFVNGALRVEEEDNRLKLKTD